MSDSTPLQADSTITLVALYRNGLAEKPSTVNGFSNSCRRRNENVLRPLRTRMN